MTILLLQQIIKTFFFLRIFNDLSYIVTMINQVVYDLRVFLLFYQILIVLFSMIFAVLGVGNQNIEGSELKAHAEWVDSLEFDWQKPMNFPNEEYEQIGIFWGNILSTFRASLADFDFEASTYLSPKENYLYWIVWVFSTSATCVVFLNFIIAEASASYQSVKSRLSAMVFKEKGSLVAEAE